ncbi:competence type IV pilus assembly protein ComGB [Ornithinibacillus halophilus]|nr:competence type IV pilus assembly protein ComGB [Ornithinibacillus halophilus]
MAILQKIPIPNYFNQPSSDIQLKFLNRLSRSLNNGYSLIDALETIKWDITLLPIVNPILTHLKNGKSLDQAMELARFHPSITSYLYFVRVNGDLDKSIKRCAELFENRLHYQKKFKQVIRYPFILFIIFSILLFFISKSVLPSFSLLFTTEDNQSTMQTAMTIIDILGSTLIFIILAIPIIGISWYFIKRKLSVPFQIKIVQKVPLYRKYVLLNTSYLFATHLKSLLKTGMSLNEILTLLSYQSKLPIIAYYSKTMATGLSKGVSISTLLTEFSLLEKNLADIFQRNSNAEALEKDLSIYASYLTEELNQKIVKTITLLQPIFLIIIGLFIVVIYLTVMWPMFELIQTN